MEHECVESNYKHLYLCMLFIKCIFFSCLRTIGKKQYYFKMHSAVISCSWFIWNMLNVPKQFEESHYRMSWIWTIIQMYLYIHVRRTFHPKEEFIFVRLYGHFSKVIAHKIFCLCLYTYYKCSMESVMINLYIFLPVIICLSLNGYITDMFKDKVTTKNGNSGFKTKIGRLIILNITWGIILKTEIIYMWLMVSA